MIINFKYELTLAETTIKDVEKFIVKELEENKTDTIEVHPNEIIFENGFYNSSGFMTLMKIIKKGYFKLEEEQDKIKIRYQMKYSFLIESIIICLAIVFGILHSWILLIAPLILALQLYICIDIVKAKNFEIIKRMKLLGQNNTNIKHSSEIKLGVI